MNILLLGPPASGKGTQAELLAEKLNLPNISGGQLLREIPESDPRYKEIHEYMDKGELVPPEIVSEVYKNRLELSDCQNGYVLDGWMRNMEQKDYFEPEFDRVIFINISDEEATKRITGRRLCEDTGEIFNIYTLPKEDLKKFEDCKNVTQRADDTKEVVKNRLELFHEETTPVIEYYRQKGNLLEINGEQLPEEVHNAIIHALKI